MTNALLLRRRGMIQAQQGGGGPYDAEVQYLETDGNAYINLGRANLSILQWEAKIGFSSSNNTRRFLLAYNNIALLHYCEINVNNVFGAFIGSQSASVTSPALNPDVLYDATFVINGNTSVQTEITIGGQVYTNSSTSAQGNDNNNIYIFRLANSFTGIGQRIGRNRLYMGGQLLVDLIPVRVGQVGYMYNRVTDQLLGNSGTGDFVLGPDIQ